MLQHAPTSTREMTITTEAGTLDRLAAMRACVPAADGVRVVAVDDDALALLQPVIDELAGRARVAVLIGVRTERDARTLPAQWLCDDDVHLVVAVDESVANMWSDCRADQAHGHGVIDVAVDDRVLSWLRALSTVRAVLLGRQWPAARREVLQLPQS